MGKTKSTKKKRPRGKVWIQTVPPDIGEWLEGRTEKVGATSVQETVRQILAAARMAEQEAA